MTDVSALAFAAAFGAGVVSFLSPCVLPLVPGYASYVAGDALANSHGATVPRATRLECTGIYLASLVWMAKLSKRPAVE